MTPQEIQNRIENLEAWVAHITVSVDALHDLVVAIARAGEEADKRIAELAESQKRTEDTLRKLIERGLGSNGKGS